MRHRKCRRRRYRAVGVIVTLATIARAQPVSSTLPRDSWHGVSQWADVPRIMAVHGQRYRLSGFSKELDWRPLHFVDSVPANRVCDACGLLPRVTTFLPCRHVVCRTCYRQCVREDLHACPLDENPFTEEDIEWRDFPLQSMLNRKVKCWNEDNGCELEMPASDMLMHFYEDCAHHSTQCPKCSASVLCSNMCRHRRGCRATAPHKMAENWHAIDVSHEKDMFMTLDAIIARHVAKMRSWLDGVVPDTSQCDKLTELTHALNLLRETVMQSSEKQTRATNETGIASVTRIKEAFLEQGDTLKQVSQLVRAIHENVTEASEDTPKRCIEAVEMNTAQLSRALATDRDELKKVSQAVGAFQSILRKALEEATDKIREAFILSTKQLVEINPNALERPTDITKDHLLGHHTLSIKRYVFYVNGMKSLKETAMSAGFATYWCDPVYLAGYCISPGVHMNKNEKSVLVHTLIRLSKGVIDEFLRWPFNHQVKATFVNSSKFGCISLVGQPYGEWFARPNESLNTGTYFHDGCDIEVLERDGYTSGDKLCVRWELLPPERE